MFLAPKKKYCLTINEYGVIDEHKTFKGFTIVSDNLNRKEHFKMASGDNLVAEVPLSWKKSFSQGVVIPHKMRICNKCTKDQLCDGCDSLVNQKKEFSASLNELKREKPNDRGHMLPKYIITETDLLSYKIKFSTFCTKSSNIYSCFLLFILYTLANFFNLSKVHVFNLRSINPQQETHLTSLLSNILKSFWQKIHVTKSLCDRWLEHLLSTNSIYFSQSSK